MKQKEEKDKACVSGFAFVGHVPALVLEPPAPTGARASELVGVRSGPPMDLPRLPSALQVGGGGSAPRGWWRWECVGIGVLP